MPAYTVQPGDTLPSIARALLGDSGRWRELQLYNQGLLVDPAQLRPGMELRLPPGAAVPAHTTPHKKSGAGLSRPRQPRAAVARASRRPSTWPRR